MRSLIKRLLSGLNRHTPGDEPDICIAATRRGGSTLVMELISAGGPVRYVDQPFSYYSADARHRSLLSFPYRSQFIDPPHEEKQQIQTFVADLLAGRLSVNTPWNVFRDTWHFQTRRTVLKILDAKCLIPWLADEFGLQVLWFVRHPVPTAQSIMRNNWGETASAYVQNDTFVDRYLTPDQHRLARSILSSGDEMSIHVMGWALENRPIYDELERRPDWKVLPFEYLVVDRSRSIDALSKWLNLPDTHAMLRQSERASISTRKLDSVTDPTASARKQIASWRSRVSEERERELLDLTRTLGVPLYEAGSDLPVHDPVQDHMLIAPPSFS